MSRKRNLWRRLIDVRGVAGLQRVTLAAALLALIAMAVGILLSHRQTERWDAPALVALLLLGCGWARMFARRGSSPALDGVEALVVLALGVAVGADNAMPVILAGLTFRSLYGSRRKVLFVAAAYAAAHLVAAAVSQGRFPDYPLVAAATSVPLLLMVPAAAWELARGLRAIRAATRREKALAAVAASYVTLHSLDALAKSTEQAIRDVFGQRLGAVEVVPDVEAMGTARNRFGSDAAEFPIAGGGGVRVLPWEPLSRAERRWLETLAAQLAVAVSAFRARADAATHRVRQLVDRTGGVALLIDADLVIRSAAVGASELIGAAPGALEGRSLPDLVHPLDRERTREALAANVAAEAIAPERITVRVRSDAGLRWVELSVADLSADEAVGAFVVQTRDVTARVTLEEDVRLRDDQDALTGLPNRQRFERELAGELRAGNHGCAVVAIDIEDFRIVNETLGLAVGDQVIAEVGRRLALACGPCDLVARLAGDAFVVLLREVDNGERGRERAQQLLRALTDPLEAGPGSLRVSASAGLARPIGELRSPESLLAAAGTALESARQAAPGTCGVFAPALHGERLERARLQAELAVAIGAGELELDFQPVVDALTGRWRGAEALVRWRHPVLGRLGPNRFVPLAEQSELIVGVGHWVLVEACRQIAAWRAAGVVDDDFRVGVNVSGVQLRRPDLIGHVRDALASTGVPPHVLVIEVTETATIDADTIPRLDELRELGVRIAIDDFGTGHSSLAYLKDLPADIVKLPRPFVRDSGTCPRSAAIVAGLVALAQPLGLVVLAEGVETRAQREAAIAAGCELIQGYLYAAPLRPSELAGMMRSTAAMAMHGADGRGHGVGDALQR